MDDIRLEGFLTQHRLHGDLWAYRSAVLAARRHRVPLATNLDLRVDEHWLAVFAGDLEEWAAAETEEHREEVEGALWFSIRHARHQLQEARARILEKVKIVRRADASHARAPVVVALRRSGVRRGARSRARHARRARASSTRGSPGRSSKAGDDPPPGDVAGLLKATR